jgi:hypothetical protein
MQSTSMFTTTSPITTSAVQRVAERRRREADLIATLRRLAYLASLQHNAEPTLTERCRLSRLVDRVDEALRKLLAEQANKEKQS